MLEFYLSLYHNKKIEKMYGILQHMEDLALISQKAKLEEAADLLIQDFEEEGFDQEDIKAYLTHIVNKRVEEMIHQE